MTGPDGEIVKEQIAETPKPSESGLKSCQFERTARRDTTRVP
jgi:hypothetical protein